MMRITIRLLCGLMLCLAVQPVSALEDLNGVDMQTSEEYQSPAYQLLIAEYKTKTNYPYNRSRSLQGSYYVKLNVVDLVQENNYYCGPASIQMVLKYLQVIKAQSEIASKAGTTTSGTYVYKVRDALNFYLPADPYIYVNINQVSFTNSLISTLQLNKPAIFHVKTEILPGYNGLNYGHYIVGTGFLVQWNLSGQKTQVWYNDPYNNDSYPDIYGENTVEATTMETAIKNNAGYIVVGNN